MFATSSLCLHIFITTAYFPCFSPDRHTVIIINVPQKECDVFCLCAFVVRCMLWLLFFICFCGVQHGERYYLILSSIKCFGCNGLSYISEYLLYLLWSFTIFRMELCFWGGGWGGGHQVECRRNSSRLFCGNNGLMIDECQSSVLNENKASCVNTTILF